MWRILAKQKIQLFITGSPQHTFKTLDFLLINHARYESETNQKKKK